MLKNVTWEKSTGYTDKLGLIGTYDKNAKMLFRLYKAVYKGMKHAVGALEHAIMLFKGLLLQKIIYPSYLLLVQPFH